MQVRTQFKAVVAFGVILSSLGVSSAVAREHAPTVSVTSATCAPLDIVILIDSTGSMDPAIGNVKDQVAQLTDEIESASGGDYRIGLIEFGKGVHVIAPFADQNAEAIRANLAALSSGGGGAGPEAWDEALVTAVTNRAEAGTPGQSGDFTVPWRTEAKKMIVLITDASPAGFDDSSTTQLDDQDRAYAAAVDASSAGIRIATVFVPNGNQVDEAPGYLQFVSNLSQSTYFATTEDGSNLTEGLTLTVSTCAADSDGDGLYDNWETDGYDANGDGIIDVDLPAMGADPQHKDLFLQVNWMQRDGAAECYFIVWCPVGESGKTPSSTALAQVSSMFAAAEVDNPDGTSGIRLHIDQGDTARSTPGMPANSLAGGPIPLVDALFPTDATTEQQDAVLSDLEARWMSPERSAVFTWVVYLNEIEPNSPDNLGLAPHVPGDTVLVSGKWLNNTLLEASVVAHELGHTLGLRHGGLDDIHRKPNYLSIMNYDPVFNGGLIRDGHRGVVDFSPFALMPLDERAGLVESSGLQLGNPADPQADELIRYSTYYRCTTATEKGVFVEPKTALAVEGIDWNCDGDNADTVVGVVHDDKSSESGRKILTSRDDWATLTFTGGSRGAIDSDGEIGNDDGLTYTEWEGTPKDYVVAATGPGTLSSAAGTLRVPFEVTNLGTSDDTFTMTSSLLGDWESRSEVDETLRLAAGASATVFVYATIPESAHRGEAAVLSLLVQSTEAEWSSSESTALIEVGSTAEPSANGSLILTPENPVATQPFTVAGDGFAPGGNVAVTSPSGLFGPVWARADSRGEASATIVIANPVESTSIVMVGDDEGAVGEEPRVLAADVRVVAEWPWVATLVIVILVLLVLAGAAIGVAVWVRRLLAGRKRKQVTSPPSAIEGPPAPGPQ